jgi:uncharacterized protein (DUF427 family)
MGQDLSAIPFMGTLREIEDAARRIPPILPKLGESTMTTRAQTIPGPDHPIDIKLNSNRVVVKIAGRAVADTHNALTLQEATYPPVQYVPRKDVDMSQLTRSDHTTYCPYKGECSYYSSKAGRANVAWTYEAPYEAVSSIKEYLAFYADRVDP